jgi:cytidylate kinase
MRYRIITISRQFGSGGRTIGKEVAAQLGIPCYDQELIQKIAQESGFSPDYVVSREEEGRRGGWISNALTSRDWKGNSNQDRLFEAQRRVILDLAEAGPCVIVGRCADDILRARSDVLKVFIHASVEKRARRIVEQYGQRDESPEKRLRDKDKRRAAYYQFYTDTKFGQAENYHLALDSGELGLDRCVDLITTLCR